MKERPLVSNGTQIIGAVMSEFSHLKFGMLLVRKTPNASNALMVLFGSKQDDGIAIRTNLENFGNKLL